MKHLRIGYLNGSYCSTDYRPPKAFDRPIWENRNNPQAHQALRYWNTFMLTVFQSYIQHISDNPQSQFHNKQNQVFKSGFEPVASEPIFQKAVVSAFI